MIRALIGLAVLSASGHSGDGIDELATWMTGTFDTHASQAASPPDTRLVDYRVRVDAPTFGQYVFYSQINEGDELTVYRQRLFVLQQDDDGRIVQAAFSFKEPARFVDAVASSFQGLSKDDVVASLPPGCELVYQPKANGFKGRVDPETCIITSSRTGKLRAIEAESVVNSTGIQQAERGFDAETGQQLFGTEPGDYYHLLRVNSR